MTKEIEKSKQDQSEVMSLHNTTYMTNLHEKLTLL